MSQTIFSKLSLIDVASNELAALTNNYGHWMIEDDNINKSLFAWGKWINMLSGN